MLPEPLCFICVILLFSIKHWLLEHRESCYIPSSPLKLQASFPSLKCRCVKQQHTTCPVVLLEREVSVLGNCLHHILITDSLALRLKGTGLHLKSNGILAYLILKYELRTKFCKLQMKLQVKWLPKFRGLTPNDQNRNT